MNSLLPFFWLNNAIIDENKQSINEQVNQSCLQKRLKDQPLFAPTKYRQNNIPTKKSRQNRTLQKSNMCVRSTFQNCNVSHLEKTKYWRMFSGYIMLLRLRKKCAFTSFTGWNFFLVSFDRARKSEFRASTNFFDRSFMLPAGSSVFYFGRSWIFWSTKFVPKNDSTSMK